MPAGLGYGKAHFCVQAARHQDADGFDFWHRQQVLDASCIDNAVLIGKARRMGAIEIAHGHQARYRQPVERRSVCRGNGPAADKAEAERAATKQLATS
jgi:hypothetical protein